MKSGLWRVFGIISRFPGPKRQFVLFPKPFLHGDFAGFTLKSNQNQRSFMEWVIVGGIVVAIFSFLAYAILAFFFPEWVGITGKVALSTERSHGEGEIAP